MRECFHCEKKGHIKRNSWHWNKEQTEEKDEKNDDEKNTAAVVFHEDVLMLSLEEQKCEHASCFLGALALVDLYINKSWSVAFIVAELLLRHLIATSFAT